MHEKAETSHAGNPPDPPEDLPYRVELWTAEGTPAIERVLGRAANAALARAIFAAAANEHPARRITLCKGKRVIADTAG